MFRSESFYVLVLELSGVLIQAHLAHDTSLKKDSVGNIAACCIKPDNVKKVHFLYY